MVGLGFKISAEHFPDMKHDMSSSEIERTVINLEGLKSVMPIILNGSDIMLARILQVRSTKSLQVRIKRRTGTGDIIVGARSQED